MELFMLHVYSRVVAVIILMVLCVFGPAPLSSAKGFAPKYKIKINVPSRTLTVYTSTGKKIKEYPVGVGRDAKWRTPTGKYHVNARVLNPVWEHPYKKIGEHRVKNLKNNPLGQYWLGFHTDKQGAYGIHGTNEPKTVGKFISHGCVRMHNSDIKKLFKNIPEGTPVYITYERFVLKEKNNDIYMKVYPDPYKRGKPSKKQLKLALIKIADPQNITIHKERLQLAFNDNGAKETVYKIGVVDPVKSKSLYNQNYPNFHY